MKFFEKLAFLITRFPIILALLVSGFSICCILVVVLYYQYFPDLERVVVGFQTRHSAIQENYYTLFYTLANKLCNHPKKPPFTTLCPVHFLLEGQSPSIRPPNVYYTCDTSSVVQKAVQSSRRNFCKRWNEFRSQHDGSNVYGFSKPTVVEDGQTYSCRLVQEHNSELYGDGVIILKSLNGQDLFSESALKAMCRFENKIVAQHNYPVIERVCGISPDYSLSYYLRLLHRWSSCDDFNSSEINRTRFQLDNFYRNGIYHKMHEHFKSQSSDLSLSNVNDDSDFVMNSECNRYSDIEIIYYNIVHYILPVSYFTQTSSEDDNTFAMRPLLSTSIHLRSSFVSDASKQGRTVSMKKYQKILFDELSNHEKVSISQRRRDQSEFQSPQLFEVAGFRLTSYYPAIDIIKLSLKINLPSASILIALIMVLYLRSAVISISTCLLVVFSYFITWCIFSSIGYNYFPAVNVITSLLLFAVGVDDVFLLSDIWDQEKKKQVTSIIAKSNVKTQRRHGYRNFEVPEIHLESLIKETLQHGIGSVLVTSITTAAAFYANLISSTINLKIFSLFTGSALIINCFVVVFWILSIKVILHKFGKKTKIPVKKYYPNGSVSYIKGAVTVRSSELKLPSHEFSNSSSTDNTSFKKSLIIFVEKTRVLIFNRVLSFAISKLWFIWLLLFTALGIGGFIAIFIYPRLEIPKERNFREYTSDHPFTVYDEQLRNRFPFGIDQNIDEPAMTIIYWGFRSSDERPWYDPNKGNNYQEGGDDTIFFYPRTPVCPKMNEFPFIYQRDNDFNYFTAETQRYLSQFCDNVIKSNQSILSNKLHQKAICFKDFLTKICAHEQPPYSRNCIKKIYNVLMWSVTDLQEHIANIVHRDMASMRPVSSSRLTRLTAQFLSYLERIATSPSPRDVPPRRDRELLLSYYKFNLTNMYLVDYPIFDKFNDKVVGYVSAFPTKFRYSMVQSKMLSTYERVSSFIKEQSDNINAHFTPRFLLVNTQSFFDLQSSMSESSYQAVVIALICVFPLLLITVQNIVIVAYAILTIAFIIFSTMGILTVLGWELDLVESTCFSLAIGLSIDFTIHYGVAYRFADKNTFVRKRHDKAIHSLRRVGSAVFMASVTTLIAGGVLAPLEYNFFRQLGIFFITVMILSYLYSTLFFLSLLRIFGPEGLCGELKWFAKCFKKKPSTEQGNRLRTNSTNLTNSYKR